MLRKLYKNYTLKYPKVTIAILFLFVALMGSFALKLEIDASSETLLLEGDKDLAYTRDISKQFYANDLLVVTYTTNSELLSNENLNNIINISNQIKKLDIVDSITNITNVPLLDSTDIPLSELLKHIPTVMSEGIDKKRVKKELLSSPVFKENLVSDDFKTTAILINLKRDEKYFELINNRDSFVKLLKSRKLTKEEQKNYHKAQDELKTYRDQIRVENHNNIEFIRQILKEFQSSHNEVELNLGGVDMIADDMVEFVKYDLKTFGVVIVILLLAILYMLFKEIKWVVIPVIISTTSIIITSGIFGFAGWEITVISSNFISLQLIMNISLIVHLIVKYNELASKYPNKPVENIVNLSTLSMAKPSFFVVITTIAGFSSLVFSSILPVIQFGWMMSAGILVSLMVTFILFPILVILLSKSTPEEQFEEHPVTSKIARIVLNNKRTILISTIIVVLFSITGALKLRVENSFIDYFKKDTQIYQGMKLIDQKLGGTTPLDIIVTFKQNSDEISNIEVEPEPMDDEFENFEDEFDMEAEDQEEYWFTKTKVDKIKQIHNYLETHEAIGKVISLGTIADLATQLTKSDEIDTLTMALLYKKLPEEYKNTLIYPYVNIEQNIARISTRVIDSQPDLKRDQLIKTINSDLSKMIDNEHYDFKVTNLLVMYNNMLQSLFDSQIKTIGVVIAILFSMFLLLFKDLKIAVIAIIANTVPVSVIFGFMGWMDIPLDMMTITIAAISIGIAVDNTIHYIHRYRYEYFKQKDSIAAMLSGHKSIGRAMFYTSTIIITGFSILIMSNFIPTIYFGILTAIAMFMAIAADLMLLPVLLIMFYKK
ncbi:MAG: MMPL family transporter [Campylobacterota bacterium]|nr:MMPL family transporter [Campylobacterota bacterium]